MTEKDTEAPMYLVPVQLTIDQEVTLGVKGICSTKMREAIRIIGTPILPCADVETVGWVDPELLALLIRGGTCGMTLAGCKTPSRPIALVRRTDMEAQVARAKAESHLDAKATAHRIIRDVAELPDRTSSKDEPDLLLVTVNELEGIIHAALSEGAAA